MKQVFYFVYILFSYRDKKLYIGFTGNIEKRLLSHLKGKVPATKSRRPLRLIYYESFIVIKDAKSREIYLKSGFGRNQIKKELQNTLKLLGYKYK